ncbi:hypothetical protein [Streptomyces malaysiensis]|nr:MULTISPECIES: hypothetical protein [Streptomyces]UHH17856.1 hypothetical protein LUV23_16835 [Streptomyces sp. HNM0561]
MEVVEADHEPGSGVVAMVVRVNGVDVGQLAEVPKIDVGDCRERAATVTLVLVPSKIEIKGDEDQRPSQTKIGFEA